MTYPIDMNTMYMSQPDQYSASPMSFSNVPDLISCAYDDDTDPSPSPPVTYSTQFSAYDYGSPPQPHIINSVEFTDLTQIQADDRARWHRSQQQSQSQLQPQRQNSSRTLDSNNNSNSNSKEAATNMRIRRRAQNRASQRAFRERKEKHVQHLEQELEQLESKHQHLAKSYTDLDSRHADAQSELVALRGELASLRLSSSLPSREGSIVGNVAGQQSIKRENTTSSPSFFDPFATDAYFGSVAASDMTF